MAKKDKIAKLQRAILSRTLLPMIIMGIVISLASVIGYKNAIKTQIRGGMSAVAASVAGAYDAMYPGQYELRGDNFVSLYKGDHELTSDFEIVDSIHNNTDMEISLCYGNTRILTTLKDDYGARAVSTGINSAVYNAILADKEPIFYDNVKVSEHSEAYYAYYYPVLDDLDQVVCIIGVARPAAMLDAIAMESAVPMLVIILISLVLATAISFGYSSKMVDAIHKICVFLNSMISGELSNNMPSKVVHREDELGQAARAVVDMQNAIRVLVERDALTGIYNRRYGGAKLRKLKNMAMKSGMPFSVCIGDIDFFKKVNDTYGHDAGDIVLKRVSELMSKFMAGKGFIARWGGEEFMLAFDKTDLEESRQYLEQMLDKIRAMEILYDDMIIKITMSFGVISGADDSDVGALLRKADARLYYGKMNGRNRVVAVDEQPLEEAKEELDASPSEDSLETKPSEGASKDVASELERLIDVVSDGMQKGGSSGNEFLKRLLARMEAHQIEEESED